MMNDVEKDQSVDQSDQDSNDILGGISFDEKDQMIESVAEVNHTRFVGDHFYLESVPMKKNYTPDKPSTVHCFYTDFVDTVFKGLEVE